jgi:hypothetical protein
VIHSFSLWHLSSPPNSSASSAFKHVLGFSITVSPVHHARFEASSRPAQFQTLWRHLNQEPPHRIKSLALPSQPTTTSQLQHSSQSAGPVRRLPRRLRSQIPNHIFLSVSAITLRIRETLRATLHTPLCSSSCCWNQFINSFRTSIYLHSPKRRNPSSVTSLLGPHAAPRCTSQAQVNKCGKPKSATVVTLVFRIRRVWRCVRHFMLTSGNTERMGVPPFHSQRPIRY